MELRKKDQLEQEEADIVIEDLNSEIMELDVIAFGILT